MGWKVRWIKRCYQATSKLPKREVGLSSPAGAGNFLHTTKRKLEEIENGGSPEAKPERWEVQGANGGKPSYLGLDNVLLVAIQILVQAVKR